MGKQINYYMGYLGFLTVAQAALDSGCVIYRHQRINGYLKLIKGTTIDIIVPDCNSYYFHIPELGDFIIKNCKEHQYVSEEALFCVIEAGFSLLNNEKHCISSNRLYIITGRYREDGEWIPRDELLTKVYNKLARVVRKVAPCKEIETRAVNPMYEDQKFLRKCYITSEYCFLAENEEYALSCC